MSVKDAVIVYVLCALITYFYRCFPFLFFRNRALPSWLNRCKDLLPCAFMAILVVYCLKAIPTSSFLENVITAVDVIITMAVHAWKQNTILSVVCGSAAYILLWNLL